MFLLIEMHFMIQSDTLSSSDCFNCLVCALLLLFNMMSTAFYKVFTIKTELQKVITISMCHTFIMVIVKLLITEANYYHVS